MPRRSFILFAIIITSAVLGTCLFSCTASAPSADSAAVSQPGSHLLDELEALPVPEGADAGVFEDLKSAFRQMILSGAVRLDAKQASAGLGTEVTDLAVQDQGGGNFLLGWTYRHTGDYDQNGQVNISDISPVGLHFSKNSGSADWNAARVADGDGNTEVNISDLTPIGQNFNSTVDSYEVQSTGNPGDPGSWTTVATVPFSQGTMGAGAFRLFSTTLTGQAAGMAYRAVAQVSGGTIPGPSYDETENNDSTAQANPLPGGGVTGFTGSLGSGAGYSGYDGDTDDLFSFAANAGDTANMSIQLNNATGDLDLYLLDTSGAVALKSEGTGPTESINATINVAGTFYIQARCYSGYSDYTLDFSISGGGGFVEPPVETFEDLSQPGDSAERKWLLNCYRPLPFWQDADRCFQNATFAAWADEVLSRTNTERANNGGFAPLTYDPHLELVAQAHARDMALQQFKDHANTYSMSPFDRLDAVDRPPYTPGDGIAGENIYWGVSMPESSSPADAVTWWMGSPGHRANILNPNVTHLGVGVYYHTGDPTGYKAYFCQVFANWAVDPSTHDWLEPQEVPGP